MCGEGHSLRCVLCDRLRTRVRTRTASIADLRADRRRAEKARALLSIPCHEVVAMSHPNEAAARHHPIAYGRAGRKNKARVHAEHSRSSEMRLQAATPPKKKDVDDPNADVPC